MSNTNFKIPKLFKEDDNAYFSRGAIYFFNHKKLVTSASFFKAVFDTDLYHVLKVGIKKPDDDLQKIFDLGSAFHCFILEPNHFLDRYYVSDYKKIEDDKIYINSKDFEFIQEVYKAIEIKFPWILEEFEHNELTLTCEFDGVPYKCKMDKVMIRDGKYIILDLKSVFFDLYSKRLSRDSDGFLWKLSKELKNLNYDLQSYCYYKAFKIYLESEGTTADVEFQFLLASKDTFDVKLVAVGAETLQSGKDKFDYVFSQVKSFYDFGYEKVEYKEYV